MIKKKRQCDSFSNTKCKTLRTKHKCSTFFFLIKGGKQFDQHMTSHSKSLPYSESTALECGGVADTQVDLHGCVCLAHTLNLKM